MVVAIIIPMSAPALAVPNVTNYSYTTTTTSQIDQLMSSLRADGYTDDSAPIALLKDLRGLYTNASSQSYNYALRASYTDGNGSRHLMYRPTTSSANADRIYDGTHLWYRGTNGWFYYDMNGNKLYGTPSVICDQSSYQQYPYSYGDTLYDGTYFWFSDGTRWYYFDTNGVRHYGTPSSGVPYYETVGYQAYNGEPYYCGKPLMRGLITGIESYVNESDALTLARAASSYLPSTKDPGLLATFMWAVLNVANGNSVSDAIALFPEYNRNINPASDVVLVARDVLFRYAAEKTGATNVGRLLPKTYTWVYKQGKNVYFRTEPNGANWNYALSSQNPYAYKA